MTAATTKRRWTTALALADWDGFPVRRAEARRRGKMRGIGIANYVEITSGAPRERGEITVLPEGKVELVMGTMASGQGHETSFAQLVSEWLGVPFDSIVYVAHDTARVAAGGGSHSGRSMKLATTIIGARDRRDHRQGPQDRELSARNRRGRHRVRAWALSGRRHRPRDRLCSRSRRPRLPGRICRKNCRGRLPRSPTRPCRSRAFPMARKSARSRSIADTGEVEIVGYAAVDDVGRAINPLILHGQTHGGIAQGVGQALLEECHYDPKTGQVLAASFMDYAMPRAGTFPFLKTALSEVPAPTNRLGVRSGGEGGTTPALGAVINAIVDALAEFGVRHIEMPATPERVWRAIQEARVKSAASGKPSRRLRESAALD